MKIAFVAALRTGNGRYRGLFPMRALAAQGHSVRQLGMGDSWRELAPGFDVLLVHRQTEPWLQKIVMDASADGAAIVWDNDDDMFRLEKNMPAYRQFGGASGSRIATDLRKLFRVAALVTCPSRHLAEQLRKHGAEQVEVIENYVPESFLRRRTSRQRLTVGWVAGGEHRLDIERLPIQAVLQRLLDERPDISVVSVGIKLGLGSDRYEHEAGIPHDRLTQFETSFDLGIAPLADAAINRARSNVKLKEYTAAGLPWLASPLGPYVEMGEREGGLLVPDDRWYEAIGGLLDSSRTRRRLEKNGRKWVETQTVEANAWRWESAFERAIERARSRPAAGAGAPVA